MWGGQEPLEEVLYWDFKRITYTCNAKNSGFEPVVDKF